jgi:hypothetical protein
MQTCHAMQSLFCIFPVYQDPAQLILSNHSNTAWWFASNLFAIFKVRQFPAGFEQGKIRKYWESDLELEKWFDPEFQDFID